MSIEEMSKIAAEFKGLQDRFRQTAEVKSLGEFEEFEATFEGLMDRMDAARANSITPPERFFVAAQKKIDAGDYSFSADNAK